MSTASELKVEEIERGSTAVATRNGRAPVQHQDADREPATTPGALIRFAIESKLPVAELKEIVALHETMEARQAVKDFTAAMTAFQQECPPIKKGRTAKIVTSGGGSYSYTYAELDDIARTVNPILAKHGLSYSWDSSVDKDMLTCVCTLRHEAGHSVSSSFTLPTDTKSAMSAQQKYGAALTFAKRQTLSSSLGLTTTDDDTDTAEVDPTKVSEDQATVLTDLVAETGADLPRFLKFLGVASIADIRAADYARAKKALEQKKERVQG